MTASQGASGSQKPCRMCRQPMAAARGRSREHVIAAWLQRDFGIENRQLAYTPLEDSGIPFSLQLSLPNEETPTRRHPFGSLLVGSICKQCNDGWMSGLEGRARPDLTHLIKGRGEAVQDSLGVALWALKTAYTLTLATDPPIGRVPGVHGASPAHEPQGLPAGVNVLLHLSSREGWWFSSVSTHVVAVADALDDAEGRVVADALRRNAYCYLLHLGRMLLIVRYWPDNLSILTYDGRRLELLSAGTRTLDRAILLQSPGADPLFDLIVSMETMTNLRPRTPSDWCLCGSGVAASACAALGHTSDLAGNWGWLDA